MECTFRVCFPLRLESSNHPALMDQKNGLSSPTDPLKNQVFFSKKDELRVRCILAILVEGFGHT